MAEENTANPNAETSEPSVDNLPANDVKVEDAGTLKRKVTVTVPRARIDAKRDELFGDLSGSAQVPGFRIGHAPRRLLEKRFGKEIAQDVRNGLIGAALGDAIEQTDLKSVGEPDLDLEKIEVPETGDMEFSFEVEVAPDFELPEFKGIKVDKPVVEITDERVDQEIDNWAQSQVRYEPAEEPAEEGDVVTAGAKITIEGQDEPLDRPGLQLRVAPGQVEAIPLVELAKELTGKKAGDSATVEVTVPDTHPNEDWRGKKAKIEIQISQVRRRIMPTIDDEFASRAGFDSLGELRDYVRRRMEGRLESEVRQAMRNQIRQHLLDSVSFDLPEGVVKRHTAQLVQRRAVELLQQGIPRERIEEHLTQLQAAADEQARRDLRLEFILDKVAETHELGVSSDELNARIAQMAAMYNRRPERVRQELSADGSLEQLATVMRQEKAIDVLLADAEVSEVTPEQVEAKSEKKSEKKAAKKDDKKNEKTEKKTEKKAAKKTAKKTKKVKKAKKEEE